MSRDTRTEDQSENERGLFPVHPKWFKIGFYLFLLLWVGYLLFQTQTYTETEDYLVPSLVGVPLILLILLQLFIVQYPRVVRARLPDQEVDDSGHEQDLEERFESATESTGSRESKAEEEMYEIRMIAWVLVLPFMMYYLGMGWTLIVYVFAFTWYFVRSLKLATIVTATVVTFVYVLFIRFLSMIVWTGVWPLPDPLQYLSQLL